MTHNESQEPVCGVRCCDKNDTGSSSWHSNMTAGASLKGRARVVQTRVFGAGALQEAADGPANNCRGQLGK